MPLRTSFGKLLKYYRDCENWTQEHAARRLDVAWRTYQDWEEGKRIPNVKNCENIINLFKLSEEEANTLRRVANQTAPELQNLPFPKNPFFTGRKAALENLTKLFEETKSVAITQPVSVNGLGGIGKTELALEYAHLFYPDRYRTVLWIDASNRIRLEAGYKSIAELLKLSEKKENEIDQIIEMVKIWLEGHTGWLLILDNVDDLQLARSFIPARPRGHILLTTRSQIVGNIATPVELKAMEPDEGLLFLLQRAGVLSLSAEPDAIASDIRKAATLLVELLGGHPLALDQAGAYINETQISFADYVQIYHKERLFFLDTRGSMNNQHPETVVVTFLVSFKMACELYPLAADVMHFCAFLHPDDIPEELFIQTIEINPDEFPDIFSEHGALIHIEYFNNTQIQDSNIIAFNNAIRALRRYSLIKRHPQNRLLTVHRLVQAVIQDSMNAEIKKQWMKRALLTISTTFPVPEFGNWQTCERLLSHSLICTETVNQANVLQMDVARILQRVGWYLYTRGRYQEAESPMKQDLTLRTQLTESGKYEGAIKNGLVTSMSNMAALYRSQKNFEQAELLLRRVLEIEESTFGPNHQSTANTLNNLAALYLDESKYEQAEPLLKRALAINEPIGALKSIAQNMNNLGSVYLYQKKYEQAQPLLVQALAIRERLFPPEHPIIAQSLDNLASLYIDQERYEQAELLLLRELAIQEKVYGVEDPAILNLLSVLVDIYAKQGKYKQAELRLLQELTISEKVYGPHHLRSSHCLSRLARIYLEQKKNEQVELRLKQICISFKYHIESGNFDVANPLRKLVLMCIELENYKIAEPLVDLLKVIHEKVLGSDLYTATYFNNLALNYLKQKKYIQAEWLYLYDLNIFDQGSSADHDIKRVFTLYDLALLYQEQKKYEQAEPLLRQVLVAFEQIVGPDKSATKDIREKYESLLKEMKSDTQ